MAIVAVNGFVAVDHDLCDGCDECTYCCPVDVFFMRDVKAWPDAGEECLRCDSCVEECPTEAIEILEDLLPCNYCE